MSCSGRRKQKEALDRALRLVELGLGREYERSFDDLEQGLRDATTLSNRNPDLTLYVYKVTSDLPWAAVVAQCKDRS